MTTVAGITFMKKLNLEGEKPISYLIHSSVHKNNIYDIEQEAGFAFIGISWVLDQSYFLNMKGSNKCILCLDDSRQIEKATKHSIPHFVCPSAVFCSLNEFKYEPKLKRFDAVLNCRNSLWKRRHFAANIKDLAIIYYPSPRSSEPDDLKFDAAYNANLVDGKYRKLKPNEVNSVLNQCSVGLILSSKEGSPRAVVEYLLCGLPVVSTKANCGRWEFLNQTNCIIVGDSVEEVNTGVKIALEYLENGIFVPEKIALDARNKIDTFRKAAESIAGVKLLWD